MKTPLYITVPLAVVLGALAMRIARELRKDKVEPNAFQRWEASGKPRAYSYQ